MGQIFEFVLEEGGESRPVRLGPVRIGEEMAVELDGETVMVTVLSFAGGFLKFLVGGRVVRAFVGEGGEGIMEVTLAGHLHEVAVRSVLEDRIARKAAGSGSGAFAGLVRAHMPGKIVDVPVSPGQEVRKGDVIMVLEAMKMENAIKSPGAGRVKAILVTRGDPVEMHQVLLEMETV